MARAEHHKAPAGEQLKNTMSCSGIIGREASHERAYGRAARRVGESCYSGENTIGDCGRAVVVRARLTRYTMSRAPVHDYSTGSAQIPPHDSGIQRAVQGPCALAQQSWCD